MQANLMRKAFVLAFIVFSVYYFSRWPIIANDTDMWYHLENGRQTVTSGTIPGDSYFSFREPPRQWTNYYWLFQVVIYKVYSFSGYYGLVVLRSALFSIMAFTLYAFFFRRSEGYTPNICLLAVLCLYILMFIVRYQNLRPHTFSFILIPLFIYLLEFRPRWTLYLLPVLAALWANLHGVEYPVMVLIVLSYLLEYLFDRYRGGGKGLKAGDLRFIAPAAASIAALYLTPYGASLMAVPFASTKIASTAIAELQPMTLDILLNIKFALYPNASITPFSIIFLASTVGAAASVVTARARLSHLLMYAGGLFLIFKGQRFAFEFALLSMPLIRQSIPRPKVSFEGARAKAFYVISIALLACLPFICILLWYGNPQKYPVSNKYLPKGVVAFLKHVDTGGKIVNDADTGGYMRWELYPKYLIFMDMEIPFLFKDEDFYEMKGLYLNSEILSGILQSHSPSYISVPRSVTGFKRIISGFPQFGPVFFDDKEILYMNKEHFPELFNKYGLNGIEPTAPGMLSGREVYNNKPLLERLLSMTEIYPGTATVNYLLAEAYKYGALYGKALRYSDSIVDAYPSSYLGYAMRAGSLKGLGRYGEAVSDYKRALSRTDDEGERSVIRLGLGGAYFEKGDFQKAYRHLKVSISIYSASADAGDMFRLGYSAYKTGNALEALAVLEKAYEKVPAKDRELREKISGVLERLREDLQAVRNR